MTIHTSELRYERKMTVEGERQSRAILDILSNPAGFRKDYNPRYVNSIYFDTHAHDNYLGHVNGDTERIKLRVRWYGNVNETNTPVYLECKRKSGALSRKDRFYLGELDANRLVSERGYLEECLSQADLPSALSTRLRLLVPVAIIRYFRDYFVSFDRKFRLTRDTQLQVAQYGTTACQIKPFSLNAGTIVELKYAANLDNEARNVANALRFGQASFSKYVTGISRLNELRLN